MRHFNYIIACALLNAAQITAVSAADPTDNPLLKESALTYHYPPFDKIKDEHFAPAIEAGMHEQLKEIEPIANNSAKPTFENTVVALERTGRVLDRADRTFSNLNACNTNPNLQKIDKEMAPKLAAHRDAIHLNGKLFARLVVLAAIDDHHADPRRPRVRVRAAVGPHVDRVLGDRGCRCRAAGLCLLVLRLGLLGGRLAGGQLDQLAASIREVARRCAVGLLVGRGLVNNLHATVTIADKCTRLVDLCPDVTVAQAMSLPRHGEHPYHCRPTISCVL